MRRFQTSHRTSIMHWILANMENDSGTTEFSSQQVLKTSRCHTKVISAIFEKDRKRNGFERLPHFIHFLLRPLQCPPQRVPSNEYRHHKCYTCWASLWGTSSCAGWHRSK